MVEISQFYNYLWTTLFAAPNGNDEDVGGKYRHFFGGFGDSITWLVS